MPATTAKFSKRSSKVFINEDGDNYVIDYDWEGYATSYAAARLESQI